MKTNFFKYHFRFLLFSGLCLLHYIISLNGANSIVSLLYFFIGFCIIFYNETVFAYKNSTRYFLLKKWIIFSIISILFIYSSTTTVMQHPLNYKEADMLPIIKEMGERFLKGQSVYDKIPTIWNGVQPIYLPAMWLPYTIPSMLNIDIRWMSIMAVISSFLIIFTTTKSNKQLFYATLFYAFTFYYLQNVYAEYIIFTEEAIILLYTIMLYYCGYKKKWTGIFLLITLLVCSRGWVLLSIPLIIWYYFKQGSITSFLKHIVPSVLLCIFFILITPVGQYKIWLSLPQLYKEAAIDPGNGFKYIPVFNKFGLVKILKYEYRYLITYIGVLLTSVFLIYASFFRKKKEGYLIKIITISLFCFFSFIIIPYEYLMFTMLFGLFGYLHFNDNFLKRN
jgi:hypothetical protein